MKTLQMVVLLAATFCLVSASGFFIEATSAANESRMLMAETEKRLVYTDQNLNALLVQLGLVADNVRKASEAQKAATTQELRILKHTDQLLTQTQASVKAITEHSTNTLDALNAPIADMDKTLQTLNQVVADGHIPQTLDNLQETSRQTSIAAAHIAQSTADMEKVADHYEKQLTKPASLLRKVYTTVLIGLRAFLLLH